MSTTVKTAASKDSLPYLNELGFSIARILVILVPVAVAVVSFISGGTILATGLRTGIAVLAVGLIGWLINWILVGGGADTSRAAEDIGKKPAQAPAHTIERSA